MTPISAATDRTGKGQVEADLSHSPTLQPWHLDRLAVVSVRHSSPHQVAANREEWDHGRGAARLPTAARRGRPGPRRADPRQRDEPAGPAAPLAQFRTLRTGRHRLARRPLVTAHLRPGHSTRPGDESQPSDAIPDRREPRVLTRFVRSYTLRSKPIRHRHLRLSHQRPFARTWFRDSQEGRFSVEMCSNNPSQKSKSRQLSLVMGRRDTLACKFAAIGLTPL
jgi:hypothetical protein